MFNPEGPEIEPTRKFKAHDAGHIIFTYICIVCSGILLFRDIQCAQFTNWNTCLFYGCVTWLAYLMVILMIQFTHRTIRTFLGYQDLVYLLFHIAMSVWANILFYKYRGGKTNCVKRWEYWSFIYVIFGYIMFVCQFSVVLMYLLREANHRRYRPVEKQYFHNRSYGYHN